LKKQESSLKKRSTRENEVFEPETNNGPEQDRVKSITMEKGTEQWQRKMSNSRSATTFSNLKSIPNALENIFCNLKDRSRVISVKPFYPLKKQESSLRKRKGLHATLIISYKLSIQLIY